MRNRSCISKQQNNKKIQKPIRNPKREKFEKSVRVFIDSLYGTIYKLKKRLIDKERYISFLKSSLEECGKDYKREFIEYKRVKREKGMDVFIDTVINNNRKMNEKEENNRKKQIEMNNKEDMINSSTNKEIDKFKQIVNSSLNESFHSCVDILEECEQNNKYNKNNDDEISTSKLGLTKEEKLIEDEQVRIEQKEEIVKYSKEINQIEETKEEVKRDINQTEETKEEIKRDNQIKMENKYKNKWKNKWKKKSKNNVAHAETNITNNNEDLNANNQVINGQDGLIYTQNLLNYVQIPNSTGPPIYLEAIDKHILESLYEGQKEQERKKKEIEEANRKAEEEEIEFYKQYYKDNWQKYYREDKGIVDMGDKSLNKNNDEEICTSKLGLTKEEKLIKDEKVRIEQKGEIAKYCKEMETRILKENKEKVEKLNQERQLEQMEKEVKKDDQNKIQELKEEKQNKIQELKEEIEKQEKKKREENKSLMKEFKEEVEEKNRTLMDQCKKEITSRQETTKKENNNKMNGKWKKKDERKKQSKKKRGNVQIDEGIIEESEELNLIKERIQNIHDTAEQKMDQAEDIIENQEYSLRSLMKNAVTLTDSVMSWFNRGDSAENQ